MRVATGGLFHESNTFCRPLTTLADFERTRLYSGAEVVEVLRDTETETAGFVDAADSEGFELVPAFHAWAWPAGPLTDDCFRTLLERLKAALEAAGPVDAVLLTLHGAMVTESEEDPDGLILAEARSCLPPGVPLVATFDLHANLSPLMVRAADALVGYRTYPHVDLRETGRRAGRLLARMVRDGLRPSMALAKPPLMPHIVRQRTADGPMAELQALARSAEEGPGVLDVSIAAGFAYADVPRMGMGVLATTEADGDRAAELAEDLSAEAWARREAFTAELPGPEEAIERALAEAREGTPVVVADIADNVGGGAPGDGTVLLTELLRQGPEGALVLLADPQAVAECAAAGPRAGVRLSVGGKTDTMHGPPVTVAGRVVRLGDGIFRNRGPMRDGLVDDMGRTAVLDVRGLTLVLTERKLPMWNLEQLRSLGIEPLRLRVIVCKGAVAHRAAYEPIASAMIEAETPGCCAGDVRSFEYHNIRRPLFPIDRW